MGNQHSAAHATLRPRKNVHWKTAGRPAAPGKPDIVPAPADDEPHAVTLRWPAPPHDGGAPLLGYQVECNRLGSPEWIRTQPPLVARGELVLSGLEPPHRYQFRVAALNAAGRSDYSELSDVLTVSAAGAGGAGSAPPLFLQHLRDCTALENDAAEFRVTFSAAPAPTVAWFKDDYEIFSSRRTAITTTDSSSVLLFHQTLASDEGEIKCTATNRAGHAVSKARLSIEAAPKLRYPRQYEDGLLYEVNETIFLKTTIVGKPTPRVEWRHDGQPVVPDERVEVSDTGKVSVLKVHAARRSDRGEYQVTARNAIGEDTAAFLVTVTAPPEPPGRVAVARQVDKSVTLDWQPPDDDGGCRVGNYVVEYYRTGWNVWLKATTSRKTSVTLFDLIEGSEYRFRVKAESPYGMSAPSAESAPVRIPGRAVDMDFLAVEARIISEELTRVEGEEPRVSPAPRRKRTPNRAPPAAPAAPAPAAAFPPPHRPRANSNEFMLVLYPDTKQQSADTAEKRKSFQLELEEALSPPPLSLSAPELRALAAGAAGAGVGPPLRAAVSSTELLHERAMARFYRAVELEQQHARRERAPSPAPPPQPPPPPPAPTAPAPHIYIKTDSVENDEYSYESRQASHDSDRWASSFDEDYTASTVSTDGECSDEGGERASPGGAGVAARALDPDEDTYSPRGKTPLPEREPLKPLPLPDPNFVPKPILKRRETPLQDSKLSRDNGVVKLEDALKPEQKSKPEEEKPKIEEKIPFYKKFTKMPVQKPFPFPKILKKLEPEKTEESEVPKETPKPGKKVEKIEKVDKISEEGRTVIDYYGNIVKEYGGQKKPSAQLYLNTEELKTVAEQQQQQKSADAKVVKQKKTAARKGTTNKAPPVKNKTGNSIEQPKTKEIGKIIKSKKTDKGEKEKKYTQQVVLRSAERATIVIPIDYEQLEQQAKEKVRSAIDCAVDVCLLAVAFWVYLFRDERLAIPLLALALYRQLQASARRLPAWLRARLPRAFLYNNIS